MTARRWSLRFAAWLAVAGLCACEGVVELPPPRALGPDVSVGGGGPGGAGGSGQVGSGGGAQAVDDLMVLSNGYGVEVTWLASDAPFDGSLQLLPWRALHRVVSATTGQEWLSGGVDAWAPSAVSYGDADLITHFADDTTMSAQKVTLVRRMAGDVCAAATASNAAFAVLGAGVSLDAKVDASPASRTAVAALHRRFFLEEPSVDDVDRSLATLLAIQAGATPRAAWATLCEAYVSSLNFVTD
ncbi:MAG: hypothetical protein K1X89_20050 [Myxococcaceae bacterium]|nr:hypothetical protein [Myxococcaceae bacterium]